MMERKERKPYWRHTKWQMLASVVPFLVLIIVLPLYADEPQHGERSWASRSATSSAPTASRSSRSSRSRASSIARTPIDHWHGAHEDN